MIVNVNCFESEQHSRVSSEVGPNMGAKIVNLHYVASVFVVKNNKKQ